MKRIVVLVAAAALTVSACSGRQHVAASPTTTAPATTTTTFPAEVSGVTTVAVIGSSVAGHSAPDGPVTVTIPGSWYGYPSILPVIDHRPGWVEVRVAQRPNQTTAWVPLSDVGLLSTHWRLVLSLASAHLKVYEDDRLVYDFPAGIGTPSDPTPIGHYFIAMTVPPPTPAYGAFVLATSAHSEHITDWEQSGDAIVGIHGPLDPYDDSLIGTTGARISHGCVRLHDQDLVLLGAVPPGSPLDVVKD